MIRNEMASPKLKSLSDDDLYIELQDVWRKVKLMTGVPMHRGVDLDDQYEMLHSFLLKSSFRDLTLADILCAFGLNASGELWETIPHYMQELNADWLGKVLRKYTDIYRKMWREHGEAIRKALLPPAPEKLKPEPLPESFWRAKIQEDLELLRAGKAEWIFNWYPKYCLLRRLGGIPMPSRDAWQRGLYFSLEHLAQSPKADPVFRLHLKGEQEYLSRAGFRKVVDTTRRRWYFTFLKLMRDMAIVDIWQDVDFS